MRVFDKLWRCMVICLFVLKPFIRPCCQEALVIPVDSMHTDLITFKNIPGKLIIEGYDKMEIQIQAENIGSKGQASQFKSLYSPDANPDTGLTQNAVGREIIFAGTSAEKYQIYEIRVPKSIPLKVIWEANLYMDELHVINFDSDLEIRKIDGSILLEEISGPLNLYTMDADLDLKFTDNGLTGPVSISTYHSDINLKLPSDARINLQMRSARGEVFTEFELENQEIKKEEENGCVDCMPRLITGSINGGGVMFVLNSYAGNINVLRRED